MSSTKPGVRRKCAAEKGPLTHLAHERRACRFRLSCCAAPTKLDAGAPCEPCEGLEVVRPADRKWPPRGGSIRGPRAYRRRTGRPPRPAVPVAQRGTRPPAEPRPLRDARADGGGLWQANRTEH